MKDQAAMKKTSLILLVSMVMLAAAGLLWLRSGSTARAGAPPPDLPAFEGEPVEVNYDVPELAEPALVAPLVTRSGWSKILDEKFEDGISAGTWLNVDRDGATNGEYKWGTRPLSNPLGGGTQSAWGVGGGTQGGALNPTTTGYPKNVNAWLIHGPVNMTGVYDAELSFNYWFEADNGDTFSVLISTDGTTWSGKQTDSGGSGSWSSRSLELDSYVGQPAVYIAFRFQSDDQGVANNKKKGVFLDDVVLSVLTGSKQFLPHISVMPSPTPSPTPPPPVTPTPTPPPPGNYFKEFNSNIDPWLPRRSNVGAEYRYAHRADADGGRQGFLEMEVLSTNSFMTMSPLAPLKSPPYNIEIMAKLKDPKDRHMYGIIFGADWNGQDCPNPTQTSCFNSYYELRVQYRNLSGKQFQEVKLKRIDSHDANGEPVGPTLIDWTKGGNVGSDDWIEIDVYVSASGGISISFNNKYIAKATDTALMSQPYFGLQLITRENGNARVKFDYIKVD